MSASVTTEAIKKSYLAACSVGNVDVVAGLFTKEKDKIKNDYSFLSNCLNRACEYGRLDIVEIILSNKNVTDFLTLYYAGKGGNETIIGKIATLYDSPEYEPYFTTSSKWCQLIYGICEGGHLELFKTTLELHQSELLCDSAFWTVCLCSACISGNLEFVNFIMDYSVGNNVTQWDDALMCACQGGNLKIVELTIDQGATDWNKGLEMACKMGHLHIIAIIMLKSNFNGGCNIDWDIGLKGACSFKANDGDSDSCSKNLEIIKLCIKSGATNFDECMEIACACNNIDAVKLLINAGATNFNECLVSACYNNNPELIKLFTDKGANDWNGGLENACIHGHIEIVTLMLDNGATNLNECLNVCVTGCESVIDIDIIQLLINRGANDLSCLDDSDDSDYSQDYQV